jgi:hypothetical protein
MFSGHNVGGHAAVVSVVERQAVCVTLRLRFYCFHAVPDAKVRILLLEPL